MAEIRFLFSVKGLEARARELQAQLEQLQESHGQLQTQLEQLQASNENVQAQLEQLQTSNQDLQSQLDQVDATGKVQLEEHQAQLNDARLARQGLDAAKERLQRSLDWHRRLAALQGARLECARDAAAIASQRSTLQGVWQLISTGHGDQDDLVALAKQIDDLLATSHQDLADVAQTLAERDQAIAAAATALAADDTDAVQAPTIEEQLQALEAADTPCLADHQATQSQLLALLTQYLQARTAASAAQNLADEQQQYCAHLATMAAAATPVLQAAVAAFQTHQQHFDADLALLPPSETRDQLQASVARIFEPVTAAQEALQALQALPALLAANSGAAKLDEHLAHFSAAVNRYTTECPAPGVVEDLVSAWQEVARVAQDDVRQACAAMCTQAASHWHAAHPHLDAADTPEQFCQAVAGFQQTLARQVADLKANVLAQQVRLAESMLERLAKHEKEQHFVAGAFDSEDEPAVPEGASESLARVHAALAAPWLQHPDHASLLARADDLAHRVHHAAGCASAQRRQTQQAVDTGASLLSTARSMLTAGLEAATQVSFEVRRSGGVQEICPCV